MTLFLLLLLVDVVDLVVAVAVVAVAVVGGWAQFRVLWGFHRFVSFRRFLIVFLRSQWGDLASSDSDRLSGRSDHLKPKWKKRKKKKKREEERKDRFPRHWRRSAEVFA